jgi:hypothetical protein
MKRIYKKIINNRKTLLELQELIEALLGVTDDAEAGTCDCPNIDMLELEDFISTYQSTVEFLTLYNAGKLKFNINILDYQKAAEAILKEMKGYRK